MKKKILTVILSLSLSASMFTVGALAATGTRTMEVTYRNIKLVIDGTEVVPKDAAGNIVEPFQSNGTTYLPVRALCEAMGKEVTWDGSTNTVYVGTTVALPYQVNNADLYDGSKANASFSVAGKAYQKGVVLKSFRSLNGFNTDTFFDGSAIWNTQGYKTMTFTVGHVGDVQRNATLYVALDGVSSGEYSLKWDGAPQTISIPLNGSPNVKLTMVAETIQKDTLMDPNVHKESYAVYDVKLS